LKRETVRRRFASLPVMMVCERNETALLKKFVNREREPAANAERRAEKI